MTVEEQVRIAEAAASSEMWALLKRPDEKYVTERAYEGVRPIHRGTGYSMEEAKRLAETAVLLASADPSAGAGHFIPVYPAAGIAPSCRRAAA